MSYWKMNSKRYKVRAGDIVEYRYKQVNMTICKNGKIVRLIKPNRRRKTVLFVQMALVQFDGNKNPSRLPFWRLRLLEPANPAEKS